MISTFPFVWLQDVLSSEEAAEFVRCTVLSPVRAELRMEAIIFLITRRIASPSFCSTASVPLLSAFSHPSACIPLDKSGGVALLLTAIEMHYGDERARNNVVPDLNRLLNRLGDHVRPLPYAVTASLLAQSHAFDNVPLWRR